MSCRLTVSTWNSIFWCGVGLDLFWLITRLRASNSWQIKGVNCISSSFDWCNTKGRLDKWIDKYHVLKCSHYRFHYFGEHLWGRCQSERETLKLISSESPLELEEVLMICMNWYLKVSIIQVQFYHLVLQLDECVVPPLWNAFTNMFRALRFMTGIYLPSFFSTRKICNTKLSGEGVVSITAPLVSNSLTSRRSLLLLLLYGAVYCWHWPDLPRWLNQF